MKKKAFSLITLLASLMIGFTTVVHAAQTMEGGCTYQGQCVNNKLCVVRQVPGAPAGVTVVAPEGNDCGSAQLGSVQPPSSIRDMNGNNFGQIGLIVFLSKLINVFVIICGVWTMFNFLMAGFSMILAQDNTKVQSEVKDKLTMTAVGLAIIAGAYILAGLIGLVFFGDAGYILNPQLTGAVGGT